MEQKKDNGHFRVEKKNSVRLVQDHFIKRSPTARPSDRPTGELRSEEVKSSRVLFDFNCSRSPHHHLIYSIRSQRWMALLPSVHPLGGKLSSRPLEMNL